MGFSTKKAGQAGKVSGEREEYREGGGVWQEASSKCHDFPFKSSEWGTVAKENIGKTWILKCQSKPSKTPYLHMRGGK